MAVVLASLIYLPVSIAYAGIRVDDGRSVAAISPDFAESLPTDDPRHALETAFLRAETDLNSGNYRHAIRTLNDVVDSLNIPIPDSLLSQFFYFRGTARLHLGMFQKAGDDFRNLYKRARVDGDTSFMMQAVINQAEVYLRTGDYDKSMDVNQQCLILAGNRYDTASLAIIFYNLGNLYGDLSRYDSAENYFRKSYTLHCGRKDTSGLILTLISMASMERAMNHYETARDYDQRAWHYSRTSGRHFHRLQILEGLGQDYTQIHDYANAEKYLRRALNLNQPENNLYFTSHIMHSLAQVFLESGRTDSASVYLADGMKLAGQISNKELLMHYYRTLADLDVVNKDYRGALEHYTQYRNYYDSLNNELTRSKIADLQLQFQDDLHEDEIHDLKVNHELLQLKIRKAKLERIILLLIIFFGIIVIFAIGILYRNARRAERIVEKKNEELAEAVAIKNKLFSIVAHDLKNPLNAIIGFSSLLAEGGNRDEEKVVRYAERIRNSGLQGSGMIEKLLEWSRLNLNDIHLDIRQDSVYDTSMRACHSVRNVAAIKGIAIENHIPLGTSAAFDSYSIESVLRNLLSNAIKYSPENSVIHLFAEEREGVIVISVADRGTGISPEIQEKIFDEKNIFSVPGTRSEKGTGLGMILSREFVVRNNGEIWFESTPGEGTRFSFSLPGGNIPAA